MIDSVSADFDHEIPNGSRLYSERARSLSASWKIKRAKSSLKTALAKF